MWAALIIDSFRPLTAALNLRNLLHAGSSATATVSDQPLSNAPLHPVDRLGGRLVVSSFGPSSESLPLPYSYRLLFVLVPSPLDYYYYYCACGRCVVCVCVRVVLLLPLALTVWLYPRPRPVYYY
jgi:hypothetical protein